MIAKEELKDVLLNYPKLLLPQDLILRYCLVDNPLPISYEGMANLKSFRYYLFKTSEILVPENNLQIEITPNGLSMNLNITAFLDRLEQFYNIKSIDVDKPEQLKTIKTIKAQLRTVTKAGDLTQISPSLKKDYIKYRERNIRDYLGRYERSYIEHMFIQKYVRNQLDNLNLLSECLRFHFYPITSCNNLLNIIDKNKLALFIAYQIMMQDQKQSTKHTLIYLAKYIEKNKENVQQNYSFEKRVNNNLNQIEIKKFASQSIYEYLQKKVSLSVKEETSEDSKVRKRKK